MLEWYLPIFKPHALRKNIWKIIHSTVLSWLHEACCFLRASLTKTASSKEGIMSAEKYPSFFSRRMGLLFIETQVFYWKIHYSSNSRETTSGTQLAYFPHRYFPLMHGWSWKSHLTWRERLVSDRENYKADRRYDFSSRVVKKFERYCFYHSKERTHDLPRN